MIGADDQMPVAAAFQQGMGAVAADVVERAKHIIAAADDEDPLVRDRAAIVVAGIGQIRGVTLIPPRPIEDRLMLPAINLRLVVPLGR